MNITNSYHQEMEIDFRDKWEGDTCSSTFKNWSEVTWILGYCCALRVVINTITLTDSTAAEGIRPARLSLNESK